METKVIKLEYYNVSFFLYIKSELDMVKVSYLVERINAGERFFMRNIYEWCAAQNIKYSTKFFYRKDFPITANLWNFYSYIRGMIDKWQYQ